MEIRFQPLVVIVTKSVESMITAVCWRSRLLQSIESATLASQNTTTEKNKSLEIFPTLKKEAAGSSEKLVN
jgi:hypothetical protein